jgi:hypothetical protein
MSDLGKYRKLYVRLWRHPGFLELTDAEKVLAFYILTGPQTNRIGLFTFSIATAAEDLGTVPETLKKRLVRVTQTFGWLFDGRAGVLYIPSFFRCNPPDNENIVKGNLKDLNEIPPCGLVDAFACNIETVPKTLHKTFLEGLKQRLPQGSRNQEQYQEEKQKEEQEHALRASANKAKSKNGNGDSAVDARVIRAAREVIRDSPKDADTEYLIDALKEHARHLGCSSVNRDTAIVALTQSRHG